MAFDKANAPNIDKSNLIAYPNGQIKDNSGPGDGTPVSRLTYSDLHEFFAKLMRMAGLVYNSKYDNETNGFQLVDAMIALAGKNDMVATLNTDGTNVTAGLKLGILVLDEQLICKAAVDYASEIHISGTDATTAALTVPSAYKAGDYVLLINSNAGIVLQRLATGANLNAILTELLYLKAASDAEEIAGVITTKATTPYTNQLAFARRVIGLDSSMFLATTLRNGLLSKEDKAVIDGFANPVKNIGWFAGFSSGSGSPGTTFARGGDIVSAVLESTSAGIDSVVVVTIAHAMADTNYFVRIFFESQGNILFDNNCQAPVFKPINETSFRFSGGSVTASTQNLKVHIEVVQLS